jgi:hypothetical protein
VLSYVLFGIGFVLALFIISYNLYKIASGKLMSDGITSRTISIVIAFVFIGFAVTVLASSFYTITKSEIKTRLGVIVSGISLSEIKEIVHLTSSNTLAIFYKDNEYSNIVIAPKNFDSFAAELRKMAPSIIYRVVEETN